MPARKPSPKRYARAIFELAIQRGELDQWTTDLESLQAVVADREFKAFLEHPKVSLTKKLEALERVLGSLGPLPRNLLALLTARGLLELLPRIQEEYLRLLDAHYGRERARVVTAVPLEDAEKERIVRFLSYIAGKTVLLNTELEPTILGGMVVRLGDRLLDGSTRTKLHQMKRDLSGGDGVRAAAGR
ncbi:MAG: ATP synthase F1 subunit delta [Dehalococcoidia bacterium]